MIQTILWTDQVLRMLYSNCLFYLYLACEAQTHFRSSLLALGGREATTGNASALRRLTFT